MLGVELAVIPVATGRRPLHRKAASELDRGRGWTIAFLVMSPFLYAGVSQLLGQDINWDLQNYHFFDVYWVLVNHMHDMMPAQLQTYASPVLDIPFYFAVLHLSPRLTGYLLAVVQGVSFPFLYLINRHFTTKRLVALGLAALGVFTAGALSELGNIMGDTLVAPLLFGAILVGLHSLEPIRSPSAERSVPVGLIVVASALTGLAAGLKFAQLPIALGIAAAFPLVGGTFRQRVRKAIWAGVGLLGGVLVTYGWWGYELTSRYGNPILPYMNQVFHSSFAPPAPNTDLRWQAHGLVDVFFYPIVWSLHPTRVAELPFFEATLPILELLLIMLMAVAGGRAIATHQRLAVFDNAKQRFLIAVVLVSYAVWVLQFGYYRYLIPIEMLSYTAIYVCLQALRTQMRWRPVIVVGFVAIAVLSVATQEPAATGRSPWASSYFSAGIPRELSSQSAAFLILGTNPNAFVVTFFPPGDYFARIEGNLVLTPPMTGIVAAEVAKYPHLYVIWSDPAPPGTFAGFMASTDATTSALGVSVDWSRCTTFPATVGAEPVAFHLCAARRTP